MTAESPIFVIGDVHGQREKAARLLRDAGLAGADLAWTGGTAKLWFVGDYVDRGPDGIGVLDLVIRLQREAASAGGRVGALLGNHDVLLLAARRFGEDAVTASGATFHAQWLDNGGNPRDLTRLTPDHVQWLTNRPAMARAGDRLLLHADSAFYRRYGQTTPAVNRKIRAVLERGGAQLWDRLLERFAGREEFADDRPGGAEALTEMLLTFGARQVIHGHTPIGLAGHGPVGKITGPLVYSGGVCVNVDGGMFLGQPGFAYRLPSSPG